MIELINHLERLQSTTYILNMDYDQIYALQNKSI